MITVWFACGHDVKLGDDLKTAPVCPACGETRVRSVKAPAPKFSGACRGPVATFTPLPAIPIALKQES